MISLEQVMTLNEVFQLLLIIFVVRILCMELPDATIFFLREYQ